jgi:diguanylate cyclase (GGDEF)-like protein
MAHARLRPLIALIALVAVGVLAGLMALTSTSRLSGAYKRSGEANLGAIATTFDDGFTAADLRDPGRLQRRIEHLHGGNADIHKLSVSWHGPRGRTYLVSSGHEHDPDGSKRDVTTSRVLASASSARAAPIDDGRYGFREVRSSDGVHYAELNYAILRAGRRAPLAALELHYDLKARDAALRSDRTAIFVTALGGATLLGLFIALLLGRLVVRPLDRIRAVADAIRGGDNRARLRWERQDEIGELARAFDALADDLIEALKDPLTGHLNHRAFQERLAQELSRCRRQQTPLALVALDIDDFKIVNDTLGHAAGDDALLRLARAISEDLRPYDLCGRIGGDEFMIALPGTDAEEAAEVVARIRGRAAEVETSTGQALTVSAGIVGFPEHATEQARLMHLADGAMYWSKSHGKDRAFIYSQAIDFALSPAEAAERNLRAGLVNTVHALARAVDAKDGYTHSHSQRVARYAGALAVELGIEGEQLEMIRTAGVLHDVGKIGISDAVLLKPGPLDADEFDEMKRHSELGRDIIAGAGMLEIATWVLHLHERVDGGGYPGALSGDEIPFESRVLHAADALEAMTSSRVYRTGLPVEVALSVLEAGAGTQFDTEVVNAFIGLVRSGDLVVGSDALEQRQPER